MKTTMSDYNLLPSSNLLIEKNKVRLYHYWNALRAEHIMHLLQHDEAIPARAINDRLELEFAMNIERLGELWMEAAEIVEGPIDDGEEIVELDEDVAADLVNFLETRFKMRSEEESLFRSIVAEN